MNLTQDDGWTRHGSSPKLSMVRGQWPVVSRKGAWCPLPTTDHGPLTKKNRRSCGTGGSRSTAVGAVEEALQLPAANRVLELADCLGLDLADALARHLEDPADFLQGVRVPVAQAVAELDDLPLTVGQGLEHLLDLVLEHLVGGGADRRLDAVVLDEVAEVAVLAFADGPVEADRVAADL